MTLQQPFDCLERHTRRRPRRGVARRDLTGIGEAGFHADRRLTIDHGHLEAGTRQIISTGCTDYATTKDQNAHVDDLIADIR